MLLFERGIVFGGFGSWFKGRKVVVIEYYGFCMVLVKAEAFEGVRVGSSHTDSIHHRVLPCFRPCLSEPHSPTPHPP